MPNSRECLTKLYSQFEGLIRYRSLEYHRKYLGIVELDDILQEARIIFLDAVKTYRPGSAKLSTHLYHQLARIGDYCRQEKRQRGTESLEGLEDSLPQRCKDLGQLQLDLHVRDLSGDEKELLAVIISGEMEEPKDLKGRSRLPNLSRATERFAQRGWSPRRTRKSWKDLQGWWKEYDHSLL